MRTIADPVHEFERESIQSVLGKMIFDQDKSATYTSCFSHQILRVVGVMKHINKHAKINRPTLQGNSAPIELAAGNEALWPRHDFQALDGQPFVPLLDQVGNEPVATPDVQYGTAGGNHSRQSLRQHVRATLEYQTRMRRAHPLQEINFLVFTFVHSRQ